MGAMTRTDALLACWRVEVRKDPGEAPCGTAPAFGGDGRGLVVRILG